MATTRPSLADIAHSRLIRVEQIDRWSCASSPKGRDARMRNSTRWILGVSIMLLFTAASALAQNASGRRAGRRATAPQRPTSPAPSPPPSCDACRMVPDASFEDPTLSRLAACVQPRANASNAVGGSPVSGDMAFDTIARPRRRMPPPRAWQECPVACCQRERIAVDVAAIGFIDRGPERQIYVTANITAPPNATPSSFVPQGSVHIFYTCSLVRDDHDYCSLTSSHPLALIQPGQSVVNVYRGSGPNGVVIESARSAQFQGQVTDYIVATVHATLPRLPRLRTDVGPMVVENPIPAPPEPEAPVPLQS